MYINLLNFMKMNLPLIKINIMYLINHVLVYNSFNVSVLAVSNN